MRGEGRSWGAPAVAVGAALAAVTAVLVGDADPASPWRHAYFVPVVVAALRFGAAGGVTAALVPVLVLAPLALSRLERAGWTAGAAETLVTFTLLLATGALTGALAAAVSDARQRHDTVLAVQRALAEEPLDVALPRLHACLASRRPRSALALAVRDGDRLALAGAAALAPGSVAAAVLEGGDAVFVADAGG
ncbi:MAG TPA: hypothetical protein VFX28_19045, partial [Methylomirabilota bacterium]|nr:hypothetical protein [Methylomirabilota bacterium]